MVGVVYPTRLRSRRYARRVIRLLFAAGRDRNEATSVLAKFTAGAGRQGNGVEPK